MFAVRVDVDGNVQATLTEGADGAGVPEGYLDATDQPAATQALIKYGRLRLVNGAWVAVPVRTYLSKAALIRLFTPSEYRTLFAATPAEDETLAWGAAIVLHADQIPTDDPMIATMLAYCVSVGKLTAPRAAELQAAITAAGS